MILLSIFSTVWLSKLVGVFGKTKILLSNASGGGTQLTVLTFNNLTIVSGPTTPYIFGNGIRSGTFIALEELTNYKKYK